MSGAVTPAPDASRSAVFLEEIGVGPLWRLRHAAPSAPESGEANVDDEAEAPALRPAAAFLAPPLREAAPESRPEAVPASAPAAQAPADLAVAPVIDPPVIAAPVAAPVAAAAPAPTFVVTPPPAAMPADDDSTAWFDDAPAPPAPVAVTAEAIALMDWAELRAAAAKCTRCALSQGRRAVVFGRGDERASLLLLASAPSRADEKDNVAVGGEAGVLLDNMLKAGGFGPAETNYVSHLVKCRPQGPETEGAGRAPAPDEIAACRPYLERELALTGARTIVTLGQPALRGLLGPGVPAARGAVQRYGAAAVVATYHPADLLRQGENKAGAWVDLCLARRAHRADDSAADPA